MTQICFIYCLLQTIEVNISCLSTNGISKDENVKTKALSRHANILQVACFKVFLLESS